MQHSKEQKQALKEAKAIFFKFSAKAGEKIARWAFARVLEGLSQKQQLLKQKAEVEARLEEINSKL